MDRIILKGLEFMACHGVLPEEKLIPQKFLIDVEIFKDLVDAAYTDDLSLTVDYAQVYGEIKEIVESRSFNLIEKMAGEIAQRILTMFSVGAVRVKIYKPNAPVKGRFDYFAVEIYRTNER